jgi:superfamily II DNA or RNA helicase
VYSFSLKKAMTTVNPDTGQTYLTPYKYHPIFVSLLPNELEKYAEYSKKISIAIPDTENPTPRELEYYHKLLVERSRITKNAAEKLEILIRLIPEYKHNGVFDHCLIYCSDGRDSDDHTLKSIQRVVRELNSNNISNNRFTSEENISTRNTILDDFSKGFVSTLVAIKCLDEGVDVPATRNAIIMASTGNPREYIQRRGRILRRYKGKDFAELYDFIVIPRNASATKDEKQILISEYKRFKEFSDLSLNKEENNTTMMNLLLKYNIGDIFDDSTE